MKNFIKLSSLVSVLFVAMYCLVGCSDDDTEPQFTGESKQFELFSQSNPAISGIVTFATRDDGATLITIQLSGTSSGGNHPAHIHANTAAEGGGILIDLTSVDGASGRSETVVTALNDGTPVTYEELINDLDGYINVHLSPSDLATIIAQGDFGRNELTSTSKTYKLNAVSNSAISGTAKFTKRVSGEALVSIALAGTTSGVSAPAHIHLNNVVQGGGIAVDLTPVNGATGKSETSISELNDGTSINYDGLLDFNGYINVHESANNLPTIIAQGNIGANEISYNVTNSGASNYIFNGGNLTNASNPALTFKRGRTYIFNLNASGHPFLIKTVQVAGSTNTYNDGVTNNGAANGIITFTVPANAPNTLYYICQLHPSMTGALTITD
ncbi:CHRD domain-containing protein [Paucihalobacter sp.]|uniref:CHRD domain-containing protein n=1 Tax=Paucihalobacter sp. TaxID=2850405 RepID=UPI003D1621DB